MDAFADTNELQPLLEELTPDRSPVAHSPPYHSLQTAQKRRNQDTHIIGEAPSSCNPVARGAETAEVSTNTSSWMRCKCRMLLRSCGHVQGWEGAVDYEIGGRAHCAVGDGYIHGIMEGEGV